MKSVSFWRYALSGGVAAALLSACGGSQSGVYPRTVAQQDVGPRAGAANGCPMSDCIAVANGQAEKYAGSILFFRRNANGNVRPVDRIEGSRTQLDYPIGIAMDSAGNLYAANWLNGSITVYAASAEGNVAPVRTIAGSQTKLRGPTGVAIDGEGDLFVVNSAGNRITEYAPNSNGDVRPVRVISGNRTLLSGPWGIALDSSSNIYVTNGGNSITVYAANAKGNAIPERVISGSLTQLGEPEGIAVDASGYAYVANWDAYTLLVFAPGANGNEPPARVDTSGLYGPDGVAVDARGRAYVSNGCQDNPAFVVVYAAGAVNAEPLRTIEGRKTRLNCSTSILVR